MCDHVFDCAFVYGCACEWVFVCYYRIVQFIARGNIDGLALFGYFIRIFYGENIDGWHLGNVC